MVRGLCHKGDFILASGLNDGTAIAVEPGNLKIEQMQRIVGRAWGEQTSEIYGLVNVAIGLKTNEWIEIFKTQYQKIDALQTKVETMSADISKINDALGINIKTKNVGNYSASK